MSKYVACILLLVLAILSLAHASSESEGKQVLTVLHQLRQNLLKQSIAKPNCRAALKQLQAKLRALEGNFEKLGKRRDAALKLYYASLATLNALKEQLAKAQQDAAARQQKKRDSAQAAIKLIDDIHAKLVEMGKKNAASKTSAKCIELLLKIKVNILAELEDAAEEFDHLKKKIAQAEKDVAANKQAVDDIQADYDKVRDQVKAVQDDIAKFTKECNKKIKQAQDAKNKRAKELKLLDSIIDMVERMFKESVGKVNGDATMTWQKVVALIDKLIKDLLNKKAKLKDPNPACQAALADLDAKIKALEAALAALQANLPELKANLKKKKAQVAKDALDVAKYHTMVQLKEQECNKMPSYFSITVQDPRALEELQAILELIALVENLHNTRDISDKSYKTVMAVLKKIKDALEKRVQRIEKENDAKIQCKKELAGLNAQYSKLALALQEAKESMKRMQAALKVLQSTIATKKSEIKAMRVMRASKKQTCDNEASVYVKNLKQLEDLIEMLKQVKGQLPK